MIRRVHIDDDSRYGPSEGEPLGAKALHETFCDLIGANMDSGDFDSWHCVDRLAQRSEDVEWYRFYDFVELVGRELRRREAQGRLEPNSELGSGAYRSEVNALFEESNVAWHLDDDGQLKQRMPSMLSQAMESADRALKDKYDPAREHFLKARRYLYQDPRDPANATKEIVSAVESVGRTRYPHARSLGEAISAMRKEELTSPQLLTVLEKFYAFANSEPAVRHGSPHPTRIKAIEAEFALLLGVAAIRLLIDLFE